MKHTLGPWTREEGQRFRHDQSAGIRGSDGMYVAVALDFNRSDRDEEVEANARLIASAPELLEACSYTLAVLKSPNNHRLEASKMMLDQAILKAEGRES